MKIPKKQKKYCPNCKKQTEHTMNIVHPGKRSTLMKGQRRRSRIKAGHGDGGHYSKKPIKNWARNSKVTTRKDANLECNTCHKKVIVKGGYKAKTVEIIK